MKISDFDYHLPKEFIAQFPREKREEAKLLVLYRRERRIIHSIFKDLPKFLRKGDVLVLNDTKVIPARILAKKETGGKIEVFLAEKIGDDFWMCLVRPQRNIRPNTIFYVDGKPLGIIEERDGGKWRVRFLSKDYLKFGKVPLPPYIRREEREIDKTFYQTVFAKEEGSIAAPTAGLHFTKELLLEIEKVGVKIVYITLHVGVGTFAPIRVSDVREHRMEKEFYVIKDDAALTINEAKSRGNRVIAVGTTCVRALESSYFAGKIREGGRYTELFIYPGYRFKVVDVLLTNFHQPKSTPLILTAAFCGKDLLFFSYEEAKKMGYRFLSYGDGMLII